MPNPLTEILDAIDRDRQALLASVADVPAESFDRRPSPDAWSIGEILHHLRKVETSAARAVAGALARAREAGRLAPMPDDAASRLGCLDRFPIERPLKPVRAPELVQPRAGIPRAELLAGLERSRAELLAAAHAAAAYDLTTLRAPHPAAGDLDGYQWILFVGKHERRHTAQVLRVREALGAPA